MSTATSTVTEWQARSDDLATWSQVHLVNRSDRHGHYGSNGAFTADALATTTLRDHFRGDIVVGLHSTASDNTCKWLGLDIDSHAGDDAVAADNLIVATGLLNRLSELGIAALLEDSNGDGGYHIWILFSQPAPTADVYRFAKWLIDGADIEVFPKQAALSGKGLGNWLRLPGKHHNRDHWSRAYGDGEWLDDADSVEALLALPTNDLAVLDLAPIESPPSSAVTSTTTIVSHPKVPVFTGTETLVDIAERTIDQTPWRDLLESHSWNLNGITGTESTWTRPGKDAGVSATLNYGGSDLLHVFSDATALPSDGGSNGESYGKWRFFCWAGGFQKDQVSAAKQFLGPEVVKEHDRQWCESRQQQKQIKDDRVPSSQHDAAKQEQTFSGLDIGELQLHANSEVDWIVDGVFSSDQPTLFGARSKCLKTTQLVDLTISLASSTDWLGAFRVPKKRRVLFITGEANYRAIARRLQKAAVARGTSLAELSGMVRVEAINFPKLPNIIHCQAVADTIQQHAIDVVIIDPLYRGIPGDMDTNRLASMGDAITNFAQWCQPASVIISHHVTKAAARELGSPPSLEDMTGAGVAESCGNWWLVGRNEQYQWDWQHDLCIQYGGRDEQCGARRILFNEKSWTAEVTNLHEFIGAQREAQQEAKDDAKRRVDDRKKETARAKIMTAVRNVKTPRAKTAIRDASGQSAARFGLAFAEMVRDETLVIRAYVDGANRLKPEGYIHRDYVTEYDNKQASERALEKMPDDAGRCRTTDTNPEPDVCGVISL